MDNESLMNFDFSTNYRGVGLLYYGINTKYCFNKQIYNLFNIFVLTSSMAAHTFFL